MTATNIPPKTLVTAAPLLTGSEEVTEAAVDDLAADEAADILDVTEEAAADEAEEATEEATDDADEVDEADDTEAEGVYSASPMIILLSTSFRGGGVT